MEHEQISGSSSFYVLQCSIRTVGPSQQLVVDIGKALDLQIRVNECVQKCLLGTLCFL